jgi:preprotein translocase subunit Sec61beta
MSSPEFMELEVLAIRPGSIVFIPALFPTLLILIKSLILKSL